jgi:methoxymalonate biosynthesis acyl carrier protein
LTFGFSGFIRVLERNRCRFIGRQRKCHYVDGRPCDGPSFDRNARKTNVTKAEMNGDAALVTGIAAIFADMEVEVPSPDTDLFGDGILDSLAFVALLGHLEQQFDMKCPVDDLQIENFRTIARIAEFVSGRAGSHCAGTARPDTGSFSA